MTDDLTFTPSGVIHSSGGQVVKKPVLLFGVTGIQLQAGEQLGAVH